MIKIHKSVSTNLCEKDLDGVSFYAKTCHSTKNKTTFGKTVDEHCKIVGLIAAELIKLFPNSVIKRLFPRGSALIAAVHDIGKISPLFQLKLAKSVLADIDSLPHISIYKNSILNESQYGGHPTVSFASLKRHSENIAIIAGQHHGALHPRALSINSSSENIGGNIWEAKRTDEINSLKAFFKSEFPSTLSEAQIKVLSGLTCVSDWIGSGQCFDNNVHYTEQDIKDAVRNAGFKKYPITQALSFKDIFGFETNETQEKFLESIDKPGVYIIEAPMGIGKTELSLYAAYNLIQKNYANGIYFALPTQLTSNKIHERVQSFIKKVFSDVQDAQTLLLHSNAKLISDSIGAEASPGNSWFSTSKRGLLYSFAVGTLDQALLSVMNVRHCFVRSFGLAGKVVIIDEVHTYDCYTGTILDYLVSHLREIGCTVIILSATLTAKRRSEILKIQTDTNNYPVLTGIQDENKSIFTVPLPPMKNKTVSFKFNKEQECIAEAINRAKEGQQILWIENTVDKAQEIYKTFAWQVKDAGCKCGLLHSRYTPIDREHKENLWVNLLGKDTPKNVRCECGRILVGTQVLEQSLDIDADFIISRFAPSDLLLQRIGRLWRHESTFRSNLAKREIWLIDADLVKAKANPVSEFGSTAIVYSTYVLCRSLEVFKQKSLTGQILVPGDIRTLIEESYKDRKETESDMQKLLNEVTEGSKKHLGTTSLKHLANSTISAVSVVANDENIPTRYTDENTVPILILKSIDKTEDYYSLTLANGSIHKLRRNRNDSPENRSISVSLMQHMVMIRRSKAPSPLLWTDAEKLGLPKYLYLGDKGAEEEKTNLSIVRLTKSGELKNINELSEEKFIYRYSTELGLEVIKKDGN